MLQTDGADMARVRFEGLQGTPAMGVGAIAVAVSTDHGRVVTVGMRIFVRSLRNAGSRCRQGQQADSLGPGLRTADGRPLVEGVANDVVAVVMDAALWRARLGHLSVDAEAIISGRFVTRFSRGLLCGSCCGSHGHVRR